MTHSSILLIRLITIVSSRTWPMSRLKCRHQSVVIVYKKKSKVYTNNFSASNRFAVTFVSFFDLPYRQRCQLNHFCTAQGYCDAFRKKHLCLSGSEKCACGNFHVMSHIVNSCPYYKLDDFAVNWAHSRHNNNNNCCQNQLFPGFAELHKDFVLRKRLGIVCRPWCSWLPCLWSVTAVSQLLLVSLFQI